MAYTGPEPARPRWIECEVRRQQAARRLLPQSGNGYRRRREDNIDIPRRRITDMTDVPRRRVTDKHLTDEHPAS
jgi:hypothetical protein